MSVIARESSVDAHASPEDRLRSVRGVGQRWRCIFVERYEVRGSVGIYAHEKREKQALIVSLRLDVDDHYDGVSDRPDAIYDYDLALAAIRESLDETHVNLIETVAERIATACLAHPDVVRAWIRIEKPAVAIACQSVGIEIERLRTT